MSFSWTGMFFIRQFLRGRAGGKKIKIKDGLFSFLGRSLAGRRHTALSDDVAKVNFHHHSGVLIEELWQ